MNREISGKPLVSLDAGRLLGIRQVAGVSARVEGAAASAGAADHGEVSKLLSKIGPPETSPATRAEMSRLLSKAGGPPETSPATRPEMGRLLSKIGTPTETRPA